eukprot:Pgem_evm1s11529
MRQSNAIRALYPQKFASSISSRLFHECLMKDLKNCYILHVLDKCTLSDVLSLKSIDDFRQMRNQKLIG